MNKLPLIGLLITIYGLIVLIGAVIACPAKHASISVSLFMLLSGLAVYILGKELEEIKKKK